MDDIRSNLVRVRARIEAAARRAGRDPDAVRIIAASKTKPPDVIRAAVAAGLRDFGENYVQEAAEKISEVSADVRWHMIGHLQRNKAARAVGLFDTIQSLDSVALGKALASHGAARGSKVRVFVEINSGGEASKHGVPPDEAAALLEALRGEEWLSIEGLMTVPPPSSPEVARTFFRELRSLRDRLQERAAANAPLQELSMGMTDDFEVAVEEGATMVRIGRALLGDRPPKAPSKIVRSTEER